MVGGLDKGPNTTIRKSDESEEGSASLEGSDRITLSLTNGALYSIQTMVSPDVLFKVRTFKRNNGTAEDLLKLGFTPCAVTDVTSRWLASLEKDKEAE